MESTKSLQSMPPNFEKGWDPLIIFQPVTMAANSQVCGSSSPRKNEEMLLETPDKDKERDFRIFNEKNTLPNDRFKNLSSEFLKNQNGPIQERKGNKKISKSIIRKSSGSFSSLPERSLRKSQKRQNFTEKQNNFVQVLHGGHSTQMDQIDFENSDQEIETKLIGSFTKLAGTQQRQKGISQFFYVGAGSKGSLPRIEIPDGSKTNFEQDDFNLYQTQALQIQTNVARKSSLNTVPESKEHSRSSHMNSQYQLQAQFHEDQNSTQRSAINIENQKLKIKQDFLKNGQEFEEIKGQEQIKKNQKDFQDLQIKNNQVFFTSQKISPKHLSFKTNEVGLVLQKKSFYFSQDSNLMQSGVDNQSKIDEEISLDELSSKLGNLQMIDSSEENGQNSKYKTLDVLSASGSSFEQIRKKGKVTSPEKLLTGRLFGARCSKSELTQPKPFQSINSSADVTKKSCSQSSYHSVINDEFLNGIIKNPHLVGFEHNKVLQIQQRDQPVFEYDGRLFNHFNVGQIQSPRQLTDYKNVKSKYSDASVVNPNAKNMLMNQGSVSDDSKLLINQSGFKILALSKQFNSKQINQPRGMLESFSEMTNLYPNFCMDESAEQNKDEESQQIKFTPQLVIDFEMENLTESYQDQLLTAIKTQTQPTQVYDLVKVKKEFITESFLNLLESAEPFSTIILPGYDIFLPTIEIKKPLTIKGQAGTQLIFKSSSLTLNFQSFKQGLMVDNVKIYSESQMPCIFSELQFLFEVDLEIVAYSKRLQMKVRTTFSKTQGNFRQQKNRLMVHLILIKSGSKVEFRDCNMRCHKIYSGLRGIKNNPISTPQKNKKEANPAEYYAMKRIISSSLSKHSDQSERTLLSNQSHDGSRTFRERSNTLTMLGGKQLINGFSPRLEEQILREAIHIILFVMNADAMEEVPQEIQGIGSGNLLGRSYFISYNASLSLKSCVVTGFYNQIRAGCNASIQMNNCFFTDSTSNCIKIVNPQFFKIIDSNVMRSKTAAGLSINWLSDSNNKNISRIIDIQNCDFTANASAGIEIIGRQYAAHNIKINIKNNSIYRNQREGIIIKSLALSQIRLACNEILKNEADNFKVVNVHHKANKRYKFVIENCIFENSKTGYGVNIDDSSFHIKNSSFKANQGGGMIFACSAIPQDLQIEAQLFLLKYPMSIKVEQCSVTMNMHYGIQVQEFWKGSIIIENTNISQNLNVGLYLHAKELPKPINQVQVQRLSNSIMNQQIRGSLLGEQQQIQTERPTSNNRKNFKLFQVNSINNSVTGSVLSNNESAIKLQHSLYQNKRKLIPIKRSTENLKEMANDFEGQQILSKQKVKDLTPIPKTKNQIGSVQIPSHQILTNERNQEKDQINDFADPQKFQTEGNLLDKEINSQYYSQNIFQKAESNKEYQLTTQLQDKKLKVIEDSNISKKTRIFRNLQQSCTSYIKSTFLNVQKQGSDSSVFIKNSIDIGNKRLFTEQINNLKIQAKLNRQELGKVYLINGTQISKNHGAGVQMRYTMLEIDGNVKTRIQDNDFGFQVFIMEQDCVQSLTGFQEAIDKGRIKGRSILIGGQWGTLKRPYQERKCFTQCMGAIQKNFFCICNKPKKLNQIAPFNSSTVQDYRDQAVAADQFQINTDTRFSPQNGGKKEKKCILQ